MEPIVAEIAVISGRGLGGDLGGAAGGDKTLLANGGPRLCPGNLRSVPYLSVVCMVNVVNTTSNAIFVYDWHNSIAIVSAPSDSSNNVPILYDSHHLESFVSLRHLLPLLGAAEPKQIHPLDNWRAAVSRILSAAVGTSA